MLSRLCQLYNLFTQEISKTILAIPVASGYLTHVGDKSLLLKTVCTLDIRLISFSYTAITFLWNTILSNTKNIKMSK